MICHDLPPGRAPLSCVRKCHVLSGSDSLRPFHPCPSFRPDVPPPAFRPKCNPHRHFDRSEASGEIRPATEAGRMPEPAASPLFSGGTPIGFLHSAPAGSRGSGRNDGKGRRCDVSGNVMIRHDAPFFALARRSGRSGSIYVHIVFSYGKSSGFPGVREFGVAGPAHRPVASRGHGRKS